MVTNPNKIADMCESLRPVPHNLFAPKIENSVEDLKSLVYGKFRRLYGDNPPELMTKRVETELSLESFRKENEKRNQDSTQIG